MRKIDFHTDKRSLTEGDVIELQWICDPAAERVELTMDNGYKKSMMPLGPNGTKKFRLNRSLGRTCLTITSWKKGKETSKTIRVRVRPVPTLKAEAIGGKRRRTGAAAKPWRTRMLSKWQDAIRRLRQAWQLMPERKRLASTVMLFLAGLAIVSAIAPRFMPIGLLVLMLYLAWVVLKR